jgi:hypothetical protein
MLGFPKRSGELVESRARRANRQEAERTMRRARIVHFV